MPLLEQLDADAWPVALLALRVATVVLLYLFLLTAFRALRADLRATSVAVPEREASPAAWEADPQVVAPAVPGSSESWDDEWDDTWDEEEAESWEPEPLPVPAAPRRAGPRTSMRLRMWLPVAAAVLVAGFGGTALLVAGQDPGAPASGNAPSEGASTDPFEPPTVAPEPGRVTVGLAATQSAQVRVTVDGVVEFDGTLPRGEQQEWEGGERIQVWTDSGQTLQLAVNGVDLGPYSPAMGHPDWNRIDFGFWPGWAQ